MALRLRLAVAITSSCWAELPAATALAVAMVMPFVMRVNSSGEVDFSGMSLDWNTWHDDEPQAQVDTAMELRYDNTRVHVNIVEQL